MFFWQRSSFALSTTIRSRNEPMAKPLTSWLVPSFSQHNLSLVVSGRCSHITVTKFQDKFTSLWQVNSWDNFQKYGTDMYLIRFLANFAVFCVFLWISWIYLNFAAPRPREISEGLTRKNTLKSVKLTSLKVFCRKLNEGIAPQSCEIYILLYFEGQIRAERSQLSVNGYSLTSPSQKLKRMWKNLLLQAQGSIS